MLCPTTTAAPCQLTYQPFTRPRAWSWATWIAFIAVWVVPALAQAAETAAEGSSAWTMPATATRSTAGLQPTPRLATPAPVATPTEEPPKVAVATREPADDLPPEEEPSAPFIDLMVGAHVPLAVVGGGSIELPGRLLAQLDVGGVPAFAGELGGSLIEAVGMSDPNIALAAGAFGGAVVARASAGWRPFPKAGFEVTGGYTFLSLSGSVSPQDVTRVAPGGYASEVTSKLKEDLSISSQLHNVHVGLGWRWIAADHIVIRAGLGYTQCVAASSSVEIPDDPKAEELANGRVDAVTSEIYLTYFKLPVVSLAAGYRF